MALVTTQGFDLNPRIGQGLARGIQTLGQFQLIGQRNLQAQREAGVREALSAPQMQPQTQQQQMLAGQTAGIGGDLARAEQPQPVTTQEEKIELAKQIDPAIANKQLKELGLDSASKRAEMSRFAAKLESLPPAQRFTEIEKRTQELDAQGRDSSHTRMLLDMDQETQDKALLGVQLMDLTTKERLDVTERREARAATGPKIGTFNPRDYTVESFAKFRRTNDPSVLVRFEETAAVEREEDIKAKLKLEKVSKEKRQKIRLQQLKIDETKFKDIEGRNQAIAAKETRRNEADNAVNVINNLLKGDRFSAGFGRIATATPEGFLPKETVDIKAEIAQVVNLIGLESRQKLKGQGTVSDSEATALAKSATTLANPLLSDDAARKELKRVRGIFETASARNQLKKETKEGTQSVIRFNRQGQRIQ